MEVNVEVGSPGVGPVYVSDVNGDGRNDILVVDEQGNITVHLQNSSNEDYPFNDTDSIDSATAEGMVAGLLDADGSVDVASFEDDNLTLNFQEEQGKFNRSEIQLPFSPNAIAIGDLNGDAGSDLVLVGDSNVLVLFRNASGPSFYELPGAFQNQTGGDDIAVGNLGGSNSSDFVLSSPTELNIFMQGTDGLSLKQTITLDESFTSSSVDIGDFNSDLRKDVVVLRSDNGEDEVIDIFTQGEDGNFTYFQSMRNEEFGDDLEVGDLNDDGLADIAVVSDGADNGECSVLLYLQRESGTRSEFSFFRLGNTSAPGGRIALGELNGDPYTDIVLRLQDRTYIFYQDDLPPFSANRIPSNIYLNENTVGDDLIKLDDYIKDDHTQLQYYVEYESDPELLHAVVDGVYLDFYPKKDWSGSAKFRVSAWDGEPGHVWLFSNKFIVHVNDVPDILSEPITHIDIGEEYIYEVITQDSFPRYDEVTYELIMCPEGMEIDKHKGVVNWTPEKNGEYRVVIVAKDKYGGKAEQSFVILVGEKEEFPVLALASGVIGFAVVLSLAAFIAADENARFLFFLLFIPLYTKIKREKVLDHFIRGQIYGYILANPGEHYNAIREALGLTNGSLAHHLRTLERERFVKSKKFGIYRRFYPMQMHIPEDGFHVNEIQNTIIGLIEENPGISQKEIAGFVNLTPPTINYHVGILANAGCIRVTRNGRKTECYIEA